jgi:hypothetical protein
MTSHNADSVSALVSTNAIPALRHGCTVQHETLTAYYDSLATETRRTLIYGTYCIFNSTGPVADICEHGSESTGPVQGEESLEFVGYY